MLEHTPVLREFFAHFLGLPPGMAGPEDCGSLFTHLKSSKMVAEKFLVRHFLSTQQALGEKELDNAHWIPAKENPADDLTKLHSEILPLLRLLESGTYNPGISRPLKGIAFSEAQCVFYFLMLFSIPHMHDFPSI